MHEDLQNAIDSENLTQKTAEALDKLAPGSFCNHKSWGFGQVAEWDLLAGQVFINFPGKPKHPMQTAYAAETLTPIPENHILARKSVDPEAVRLQAKEDPVGLTKAILSDHGGKATADQIAASLTPEVFDASAFRKWWEPTKKKLRSDGCFQLPAKKSEPLVLLDEPVSPTQTLLSGFRAARFLKDQIAAADAITKVIDDFEGEQEDLTTLVSQIEEAAAKGSKLQSAQALELLLARDEILSRYEGITSGETAPAVADILRAEQGRLSEVFASLPAAKQKRVLEQFPTAFEDRWIEVALKLAKPAPARLLVEVSKLLARHGQTEALRTALTRWISDRSVSSETLIWLCRERGADFPELFHVGLLHAVFSALERDMLAEKRGSRLHDLLLDDRDLLGQLLAGTGSDSVRDTMRRLMLTPVYDDLNKRSLMGRIIKLYPEMQSMIGGTEEAAEDLSLTVSWSSLEARKAAYEHLVHVEIPQNTKDIAVAREQGDLRENFGFKAAKEQQRVLMRRRSESERDLAHARGTNFENPETSQVSIGTIVRLKFDSGEEEMYSILGAWDSAPDLGIVSYKAGVGQALLGKKPGDKVELAGDSTTRKAEIVSIAAFTDLELLRDKVHKLSAS